MLAGFYIVGASCVIQDGVQDGRHSIINEGLLYMILMTYLKSHY